MGGWEGGREDGRVGESEEGRMEVEAIWVRMGGWVVLIFGSGEYNDQVIQAQPATEIFHRA